MLPGGLLRVDTTIGDWFELHLVLHAKMQKLSFIVSDLCQGDKKWIKMLSHGTDICCCCHPAHYQNAAEQQWPEGGSRGCLLLCGFTVCSNATASLIVVLF